MTYVALDHMAYKDWVRAITKNQLIDNVAAGVPAAFTAKGDFFAATAATAGSRVAVGTNGFLFSADSGQSPGTAWASNGFSDLVTTKGDVLAGTGDNAAARVGVGANDTVLKAASGQSAGVQFGIHPTLDKVTTKGDILAASAADVLARAGAGANTSHLIADSGESAGVRWANNAAMRDNSPYPQNRDPGWDIIVFDSESFDVASAWNGSFFTVPVTGYYFVAINYASFPSTWDAADVTVQLHACNHSTGASLSMLYAMYAQAGAAFNMGGSGADIIYLTAALTVDFRIYHDNSLTIVSAPNTESNVLFVRLNSQS